MNAWVGRARSDLTSSSHNPPPPHTHTDFPFFSLGRHIQKVSGRTELSCGVTEGITAYHPESGSMFRCCGHHPEPPEQIVVRTGWLQKSSAFDRAFPLRRNPKNLRLLFLVLGMNLAVGYRDYCHCIDRPARVGVCFSNDQPVCVRSRTFERNTTHTYRSPISQPHPVFRYCAGERVPLARPRS